MSKSRGNSLGIFKVISINRWQQKHQKWARLFQKRLDEAEDGPSATPSLGHVKKKEPTKNKASQEITTSGSLRGENSRSRE